MTTGSGDLFERLLELPLGLVQVLLLRGQDRGERVRETTCEMPADKFDVLVYELRQAQALMASIDDDGSGGKPPP